MTHNESPPCPAWCDGRHPAADAWHDPVAEPRLCTCDLPVPDVDATVTVERFSYIDADRVVIEPVGIRVVCDSVVDEVTAASLIAALASAVTVVGAEVARGAA